ncbi:epsin homolog lqf isoform X2 [Anticarsia gemmatalis]|uniref:epsin homolog lqf isoform X2 n=1 Tax=Anticarsia gemmatalis TaxID=129554 RepID=UPI003F767E6D
MNRNDRIAWTEYNIRLNQKMPRGRDEMQVNVAGLRRNIKNLAHNYSDAQVKVREATSNDPWGPSSTLMAEIADLTYNVMAFTEIMQMIWKRLNDHGKNWRHVYKALVLMEYLIKTGSEKVAMQCKENIFAIHTLKDFQYMEEGKDQGLNVREKAKQLVNLLKDEERLKNERARALKAKQRFAQSASAFGSDGALDTPSSPTYPPLSGDSAEWSGGREAELARPLTAGEEELQLQLALAMSREEAERDERRRRSDDVRLQLAISQSQNDFQTGVEPAPSKKSSAEGQQSHLLDLLDVNLSSPPTHAAPLADPWGGEVKQPMHLEFGIFGESMETSSDAWSAVGSPARDPWAPAAAAPADPWAPVAHMSSKSPVSVLSSPSSSELEQFDALSQRPRTNTNNINSNHNNNDHDPFDLTALGDNLSPAPASPPGGAVKKSASMFLGENSGLVNLERLLQAPGAAPPAPNPFAPPDPPKPQQMFAQPAPARLTMNELKQQQMGLQGLTFPSASPAFGAPPLHAAPADPWAPPPGAVGVLPTNNMGPMNNMSGMSNMGNMGNMGNMSNMSNISNMNNLGGMGGMALGPALPLANMAGVDARSSSPWSPPHQRQTPNPFLS